MESRLERIERDIFADIGTGGGMDYCDAVWLVDMVKAQHEYIRTVEKLKITIKFDAPAMKMLLAAQKALKVVEDRK